MIKAHDVFRSEFANAKAAKHGRVKLKAVITPVKCAAQAGAGVGLQGIFGLAVSGAVQGNAFAQIIQCILGTLICPALVQIGAQAAAQRPTGRSNRTEAQGKGQKRR